MRLLLRPLIALAVFASVSYAHGDSLRVVTPAAGATLRGGSFAEVRWSATTLPAGTEEWEAFLSIDGGKYYAFRVTPHLDIELQRFTFVVPNVDTGDARILIRTGNEIEETHFEARGTFTIVRDAESEQIIPRVLHYGHGEAARDGDPAVMSWTDGSRDGAGITLHIATTIPLPSLHGVEAEAIGGPAIVESAHESVASSSVSGERTVTRGPHSVKTERLPLSADLLLVCRRRNI